MYSIARKYRIYPNAEQSIIIDQTFGCCRFIHNRALGIYNTCKEYYGYDFNVMLIHSMLSKELKDIKKYEYPWLKDVSVTALGHTLSDLKDSFFKFFRNRKAGRVSGFRKKDGQPKGYPSFHGKYNSRMSFSMQQGNKHQKVTSNRLLYDGKSKFGLLTIPKIPNIKIGIHQPIPTNGTVETVTVSKTPSGKYFASLVIRVNDKLPDKIKVNSIDSIVGIDCGLTSYAVLNDGSYIDNPKLLDKKLKKVAHLNRCLAKKRKRNPNWKNSKRYEKLKARYAQIHEKVVNQRQDFTHKLTHKLINNNKTFAIGLEDLDIKGMMKNKRLARHISQVGWYEFGRQLKYKADYCGKHAVTIDQYYASSKLCHVCAYKNEALKLSDRTWTCPQCNTEHDRDTNAAKNIQLETYRILTNIQSNSGSRGSTQKKARRC